MKRNIMLQENLIEEDDPIIRINAGGVIISTFRSTLTKKYPDSVLAVMFGNRHFKSLKLDQDGNYFIDTDGQLFSQIIHYMRRAIPFSIIPPCIDETLWSIELDFWGLTILESPKKEVNQTIFDVIQSNYTEAEKRIHQVAILIFEKLTDTSQRMKNGIKQFSIYIPRYEKYELPWGGFIDDFILNAQPSIFSHFNKNKDVYPHLIIKSIETHSKALTRQQNYVFNEKNYTTVSTVTIEITCIIYD
jgi:hypothetical protein